MSFDEDDRADSVHDPESLKGQIGFTRDHLDSLRAEVSDLGRRLQPILRAGIEDKELNSVPVQVDSSPDLIKTMRRLNSDISKINEEVRSLAGRLAL